jgi:hypothetical protein
MNNYILDFGKQIVDFGCAVIQKTAQDADLFQKVTQVAIAILQGIQLYFFRPWQIPYNLTHGVYADTIDCRSMVQQLRKALAHYTQRSFGSKKIRKQAEECVDQALGDGQAYTSIEALKYTMKEVLVQMDPSYVHFDLENNVVIELHYRPLLSRLCALSFFFVDLGCIPLYMQEWGADFSGISRLFGQFKLFRFLNRVDLDDWVEAGVIIGYGCSVVQALKIMATDAHQNNRIIACWDVLVGQAEIIYTGVYMAKKWIFPALDERIVLLATFTAKLLGVLSIALRPKEVLF